MGSLCQRDAAAGTRASAGPGDQRARATLSRAEAAGSGSLGQVGSGARWASREAWAGALEQAWEEENGLRAGEERRELGLALRGLSAGERKKKSGPTGWVAGLAGGFGLGSSFLLFYF